MREILFRGKRVDNGKWVYGFYMLHINRTPSPIGDGVKPEDEEHIILYDGFSDWNLPRDIKYTRVEPKTVGQYTGLTDKNGTKIFEDDVIAVLEPSHDAESGKSVFRATGKRYSVDMDESRRGWWPFACGDGCGCCEEDTVYPGYCEVIGNIHDNPELVGGAEEPPAEV